jgi:hypothetical protein
MAKCEMEAVAIDRRANRAHVMIGRFLLWLIEPARRETEGYKMLANLVRQRAELDARQSDEVNVYRSRVSRSVVSEQ